MFSRCICWHHIAMQCWMLLLAGGASQAHSEPLHVAILRHEPLFAAPAQVSQRLAGWQSQDECGLARQWRSAGAASVAWHQAHGPKVDRAGSSRVRLDGWSRPSGPGPPATIITAWCYCVCRHVFTRHLHLPRPATRSACQELCAFLHMLFVIGSEILHHRAFGMQVGQHFQCYQHDGQRLVLCT